MRLAEWQEAFVCALSKSRADEALLSLVNSREAERLSVYRNNSKQALAAALGISFPICKQVLGEVCFEQLAQRYQALHPLKLSNLNLYGEHFPELLTDTIARHLEFEGLEYLADLARLEWLIQLSYYAADKLACLPLSDISSFTELQQASLIMLLRPDVHLFSSPFPLYEIWLKYQQDQDDIKIDSPQKHYFFAIYREPFKPKVQRICSELYRVLGDIQQSRTLGQINESGVDMSALNSGITRGWVCGFHLEGA